MDKNAEIQRDKKGNIFYDKETKDIEIEKYEEIIDEYMAREVLPHIPNAVAFYDGNGIVYVFRYGIEDSIKFKVLLFQARMLDSDVEKFKHYMKDTWTRCLKCSYRACSWVKSKK